ncbi:MAG: HigA family addiction module antidote protein [Planctomycetes bacterium]|nr:HigA family addiction module antidote protein [Planctomycetota bacterium]
MRPRNRAPTHPGVIFRQEFLDPLGVTQVDLAGHLGVPLQRISEIVRGRRGVSVETAWLLAGALGATPEFWTNLQAQHGLAASRPERHVKRLRRTAWRPARQPIDAAGRDRQAPSSRTRQRIAPPARPTSRSTSSPASARSS